MKYPGFRSPPVIATACGTKCARSSRLYEYGNPCPRLHTRSPKAASRMPARISIGARARQGDSAGWGVCFGRGQDRD